MPDSESPRPHPSRIGDAVATSTEAAKTLAGFTPAQAQTLAVLGLTVFICGAMGYLGNLMIQNQREMAMQAQMAQKESVGLLARTIESESEKNRMAIDSNTKLVVGSTQAVAITIGKLQVTLTSLESRLAQLEAKIGKIGAPPEHEHEQTSMAPAPRPKLDRVHQ